MIEKSLKTVRGTVYYWQNKRLPDRDTLVFLHGLTADHTLFDKQIDFFSQGYNILLWDAPAHGKSRPYTDFTYPNAAQDLKQILDENSIYSAVMIGQSMGGYIIQSFLLRYPEMVKAFIGIDTCPYGNKYYSNSDKWWLRQVEWMSHLYPLKLLKKSVAKQSTHTEYAYKNMLNSLAPYGKNEICHLMGIGFAGFLADNQDIKINCPVLILCGEYDKTGKVKYYCKCWAEATGFPLVTIKNAGHNSNADNPQQVNDEILSLLETLNE